MLISLKIRVSCLERKIVVMKMIKKFLNNEVISYLIFGVMTTLVYVVMRMIIFNLTTLASLSATLASIISILFAFVTNDIVVFKQAREGWFKRLIKFFAARLLTLLIDVALAYLLVEKFPHIIGQFVKNDIQMINTIETLFGQVLIIVLNYVLSRLFVFRDRGPL